MKGNRLKYWMILGSFTKLLYKSTFHKLQDYIHNAGSDHEIRMVEILHGFEYYRKSAAFLFVMIITLL